MSIHDTESSGVRSIEFLQALGTASKSLKDALLKRDPDAISAAVAEEESIAREFQALRTRENAAGATLAEDARRETMALANSIRQDLRASKALAMSFLSVVDRTLYGLSSKAGAGVVTYDSTGAPGSHASALLIQQTG